MYHNWSHGFHVANSIYSILKASPDIYTPYEVRKFFYVTFFQCNFSVLDCGLEPSVMTLITEALIINS